MHTRRRVALCVFVVCAMLNFAPRRVMAEPGLNAEAAGAPGATQLARLYDPAEALRWMNLSQVRTGVQPVPRTRMADLPEKLTRIDDVDRRKRLFLKAILPAALKANREVLQDRAFLQVVHRLRLNHQEPTPGMLARLARLAETYRVEPDDLDALLIRVDTVPVSLLLAQAAIETGWGTSRFAQGANALFGQHTYNPEHDGVFPNGVRKQDFRVRAFPTLQDSVAAYLRNLNSHPAYAEFRALRARARAQGHPPSGLDLAAGLQHYSERGAAYIKDVRVTIRANDLEQFRDARLMPQVRTLARLSHAADLHVERNAGR